MRSTKLVGTAVGVALIVLMCAASASADHMCKANETPCSEGNTWEPKTVFEAKIKSETTFKFDGTRHYVCSASARTDRLSSNGFGENAGIVIEPLAETFSGCFSLELGNCTTTTAGLPSPIKWHANTLSPGDGNTDPKSTAGSITFACQALTCKWLFLEQLAHTYKGGSPAIEFVKARYALSGESSSFCGKEVVMEGEREITSPNTSPVYWVYG